MTALPKAGDRCPCGVGPEHFYDTYDVLRDQDRVRKHIEETP